MGGDRETRVSVAIGVGAVACSIVNYVLFRAKAKKMREEAGVRSILASADAVCVDVDSTLIKEEGIDALAQIAGVGDDVSRMTSRYMEGESPLTFGDSLKARLDVIHPTPALLERCVKARALSLTPGAAEFIATLHGRGIPVYLVTGTPRALVEPLAHELGIPRSHVFATTLAFDDEGQFTHLDHSDPTARSGGKRQIIEELTHEQHHSRIVYIGSSVADSEASLPVALFVGFGGNVSRSAVRKAAKWFVSGFEELHSAVVYSGGFVASYFLPAPAAPRWSGRWWWNVALVMSVYSFTGSAAGVIRPRLTGALGLKGSMREGPWSYRILSVAAMVPCYYAVLLVVGTLFGRHAYFKARARRMLRRLRLL